MNIKTTGKTYFLKISLQLTGIFSKNREEWLILDVCNALYGFTMVPLYDTLGPESISFVIRHSKMQTCFCSSGPLDTLL